MTYLAARDIMARLKGSKSHAYPRTGKQEEVKRLIMEWFRANGHQDVVDARQDLEGRCGWWAFS